jgi:acyl carrier protein
MTNSEIEQKLIEIVRAKTHIADDKLSRTVLLADAGIDSLEALNILFDVEEAFDIAIPDESARSIRTFGDMVDVVAGLVPAR